jgi:hypothetical protein
MKFLLLFLSLSVFAANDNYHESFMLGCADAFQSMESLSGGKVSFKSSELNRECQNIFNNFVSTTDFKKTKPYRIMSCMYSVAGIYRSMLPNEKLGVNDLHRVSSSLCKK